MVVSLTIDNLNAELVDRLSAEAQRRGLDVQAFVKEMIQTQLSPPPTPDAVQTHHDLDVLAGTWSAAEAAEFLSATADMRRCDEDLWK